MSVRASLLAILEQGDCYGYQLRVEFERRTGGARGLNVGQVYATLDRLERDGCVVKQPASSTGHVYYAITPVGSDEAGSWLSAADASLSLEDLALKLALASTLPGIDVSSLILVQSQAVTRVLAAMQEAARQEELRETPSPPSLSSHARAFAARAQLEWLSEVADALGHAVPFGLEADPPRRGRPVNV